MAYPFMSPALASVQKAKADAHEAAALKWRDVEKLRAEVAAAGKSATTEQLHELLVARNEFDVTSDALKAAQADELAFITTIARDGSDLALGKGLAAFSPLLTDVMTKRSARFEAKAAGVSVLEGAPASPSSAVYLYEALGRPAAFGSLVPFTRIGAQSNSASPTSAGDLKLTSSAGATTQNATVVTIAHLESATNQDLQDIPGHSDVIGGFLLSGLSSALDGWLLAGILADAGILSASVTGDVFVRTSVAQATLAAARAVPNLVVVSPNRWSAIQTTRAGGSTTTDGPYLAGQPGSPLSAPDRMLWGMRCLVTPEIGDDTALVMDTSAVTVPVVQDLTVEWQTNSDDFARNKQTARAECRVALAVQRPGWCYAMPLPA